MPAPFDDETIGRFIDEVKPVLATTSGQHHRDA
jgi:hypothetical protein